MCFIQLPMTKPSACENAIIRHATLKQYPTFLALLDTHYWNHVSYTVSAINNDAC